MSDDLLIPDNLFSRPSAEIMRQAAAEPWAIIPTALQALLSNIGSEPMDLQAAARSPARAGRVARIPIIGAIAKRESIWSMLFGGTSVERITKQLREVGADDSIGTVVLDIDSPGGTVAGVPELAAEVRALRESKRVIALANGLTASAAYWIASQADEIVATPDALIGSVGVFAIHQDWSKANELAGVKVTYVSAGKYKTEGNFDEPLSAEARAHLQSIVDDAYSMFIADVARGRDIAPAQVRSEYGEGRAITAKAAKTAGMIDRIASAEETIRRFSGIKAGDDGEPLQATAADVSNSLALKRLRLDLLKKL